VKQGDMSRVSDRCPARVQHQREVVADRRAAPSQDIQIDVRRHASLDPSQLGVGDAGRRRNDAQAESTVFPGRAQVGAEASQRAGRSGVASVARRLVGGHAAIVPDAA
jgi:hypothetical protein